MKYIAPNYPTDPRELLEIFPEGKQIIKDKITELEMKRLDMMSMLQNLQKVAPELELSKLPWWFLVEQYIEEIDRNLKRLRYQKQSFTAKPEDVSKREAWEEAKRKAKERPLEEIAAPFLERVRTYGNRIKACCPFHEEKTPSFTIYNDQNTYHCYGCGANGDVISFVMAKENLSFTDAVRRLA